LQQEQADDDLEVVRDLMAYLPYQRLWVNRYGCAPRRQTG